MCLDACFVLRQASDGGVLHVYVVVVVIVDVVVRVVVVIDVINVALR